MEFTTGEIAAAVAFISALGGLWRFTIKPIFDKQALLEEWRRDIDIRIKLIEEGKPDPALRKRLTGD